MHSKRIFLLSTSLLVLPVIATAQITFDPAVSYPVGSQPSDVAIGDFNGDQIADLAATVDNPDRVELLFGNGDGTFTAAGSIALGSNASPQDIVAGDLDGDLDIDLAVGLKGPNQVRILVNSGGGVFSTGGSFPTGSRPLGMDIGDHDGDKDLDLCVGNRDSNNVTILTNNGDGTFSAVTIPAGDEPRAAAFGDFDGDTDLDMAVSNHRDRNVQIFTNNGGTFTSSGLLSVGSNLRPEGVVCADLNGDQLADIASATNGNNSTINFATVFLATGGGSFGGAVNYATGGQDTSHIVSADFNCDQMMDLATLNQSSGSISVMTNLGGGTFGEATILTGGDSPENLAAGDLDMDNVADIALANRSSGDVTVHINQTCDAPSDCLNLTVSNLVGGGKARFNVTCAADGEHVAVVYSLQLGQTLVSGTAGYCATFGLKGVSASKLVTQGTVVNGTFSGTKGIPANASGLTVHFQAAQRDTCPAECVSNVASEVVQ